MQQWSQTPNVPVSTVTTVVLALSFWSSLAFSNELLLPGSLAKMAAGAGQTVSRGGPALFYNPANAIYSKFVEGTVDLSYGTATYTYQHTDVASFDPVLVGKALPFVTAGLSLRVMPSITVAAAILPTGLGSSVENATGVPGNGGWPNHSR